MSNKQSPKFILPPYLLSSIAQHGNKDQRSTALTTLNKDITLRALRIHSHGLRTQHPPSKTRSTNIDSATQLTRTIYDAQHTTNLPGTVVRNEGTEPSTDETVNEAYDALGWTHEFFAEFFHRNSIDDEGMPLNATVHYGRDYANAFWDGERMVFGDGDNDLFNRFTVALDIVGHELTHGVIEDEAQLAYMGQSGALNESLADVFGSLVKQYALKQTADQADWLIGKGLFTQKVEGDALRSMKAPGTAYNDDILGKDPQPAHMRDFVQTMDDNGGVHYNSGIPNRAFYLAATSIGGYSWEHTGRIWYETMLDSALKPNASFRTFARLTIINAQRLYGRTSTQAQAVSNAWKEVGVRPSNLLPTTTISITPSTTTTIKPSITNTPSTTEVNHADSATD